MVSYRIRVLFCETGNQLQLLHFKLMQKTFCEISENRFFMSLELAKFLKVLEVHRYCKLKSFLIKLEF